MPANNSLERTQPQRDFMYDVAVLSRRKSTTACGPQSISYRILAIF